MTGSTSASAATSLSTSAPTPTGGPGATQPTPNAIANCVHALLSGLGLWPATVVPARHLQPSGGPESG
jgi:hypothetical protein